jgi:hypothetical protein
VNARADRTVWNEGLTERVGERTIAAILLALAAVVFVGGVLAVVSDDDAIPAAGARVRLEGIGTVERADGSTGALRDGDVLGPGDEVEMEEGTAVLELAGGGTAEVRSGIGDVDDTRLEVGSPLRLLAGDALVQGPVGVAVEAAGTLVTLRDPGGTAARVRRELAVTTATYRGDVDVDSAGQEQTVPTYRQLAVASVGRLPDAPDPIEIDGSDPWDQRFLGSAIALTRSLDPLASAFTAQGLGRDSAEDYAAVLPVLADEEGFTTRLIDPARPDGDTLVGGAIAALATTGDFDDRWSAIFEFRDAGAEWGLVALDQGVEDAPVLGEVEAALGRSVAPASGEVAAPPATTPTTTGGGTTPTSTTTTTTPGTTPTTAPPSPPATPPTTPPVVPPTLVPTLPTTPPITPSDPVPETGNGLLDGLLQPVGDLLGGLLGG